MSHRDGWRKPLSHVWQHLSIASGYLEVNTGRGEHLGQLTKANFPDAAPSVLKTPGNATVPCECVCVWQPSNRNVNSMHLWQPAQLKQPKPRKGAPDSTPWGNQTELGWRMRNWPPQVLEKSIGPPSPQLLDLGLGIVQVRPPGGSSNTKTMGG